MAAPLRNTSTKIAARRAHSSSMPSTHTLGANRVPTAPAVPSPVFFATNTHARCLAQSRLAKEQLPPPSQSRFSRTAERWWMGEQRSWQDGEDPNKAKLGKTLRILQDRLPTLLQSPLPQDILAPNISLLLFPTTHPHLPAVSGKVAYNAALWTSPIAWNRLPIIGNVRIEILAERVTSEPLTFLPRRPGAVPEQLVVRWCEKRRGAGGDGGHSPPTGSAREPALWRSGGVDPNKAFTGLFIFDFDAEGRILTHTIEQAQEGGDWEKGGGSPLPMFEKVK